MAVKGSKRPKVYEGCSASIVPTASCSDTQNEFAPASTSYRSNFSPSLLWACVKNNNTYLRKFNHVEFSTDPFNAAGLQSERHCGFVKRTAVAPRVTKTNGVYLHYKQKMSLHKLRRPKSSAGKITIGRDDVKVGKAIKFVNSYAPSDAQSMSRRLKKLRKTHVIPVVTKAAV